MIPNSILDALRATDARNLADLIGDTYPDSPTSPGATFLTGVRDAVVEMLAEVDDDDLLNLADATDDRRHEIADGAVPVGTYAKWQAWTDLAGWEVDLSDYGFSEVPLAELGKVADWGLYSLARSVADALVSDAADQIGDAVDAADQIAREIGEGEGTNAASWWQQEILGGRATGDVTEFARRTLAGLSTGDIMIADLVEPDLSGQMADGTTVADLLARADLADLSPACEIAQNLGDAYESGFYYGAEVAIAEACRSVLETEIDD